MKKLLTTIGVKKKLITIAGILLLGAVGFAFRDLRYFSPEDIFRFLELNPFIAPLAFITIFVLMTLLALPTLPLNIGAGFLWGPFLGGFYTVLAASLGAGIAFCLARYLAGDFLYGRFRKLRWFSLVDQVDRSGWKVIAFTRLNPIFPTAILNYLFGLTAIKFWPYYFSTVIFISPMVMIFAYLGDSAGGIVLRDADYQYTQTIFGISAALTMLLLLYFGFKRFLAGRH